jgi:hypothetical protein
LTLSPTPEMGGVSGAAAFLRGFCHGSVSLLLRFRRHHKEIMSRDDGWIRHEFAPGEEPTVYTADLCAEVGHKHCEGIARTFEGYEGEPVFCICWCHKFVALEPN